MRFAGIDYGKKKIGVALASENSSLAFAHSVIENNESKESKLLNFFSENKVTDVVLGESRDFKGNENSQRADYFCGRNGKSRRFG